MTRASLFVGVALLAACQQGDVPSAPSSTSPAALAPATAVTQFRDRIVIQEDALVQHPCTGEEILLHLKQLFMIHEVDQVGKAFHGHITILDRGTRGVGLTSGATYRQTGAEADRILLRTDPHVVNTFTFGLNLIGQGRAPDFRVHTTFHVTITPAGVVTATVDKVRETCK